MTHIARSVQPLLGGVFSRLEKSAYAQSGPVYPLHVGDSWLEPLGIVNEPITEAGLFKYAPPTGEERFIDAVIDKLEGRYGIRRAPKEVVAVSGATAGIRDVVQAVVDPGKEVIIPAPFWPLVRGTVVARGARAVEVPFFDRLDSPDFDPEKTLEEAVTDKTVLLYLNSPNNPTGRILSEDILSCIANVAKRNDLMVICDEVYDEVYFEEAPPVTWAREDLINRTIAVHSMSKAYAMAGARVGWAHGPAGVMSAVRAVHTYQDFGPAKLQQLMAARVLKEGDIWMKETRSLYRQSSERVTQILKLAPIDGGTFAFVKLPRDPEAFLMSCAKRGVLLTSGGVCGEDYRDWCRICFTAVDPKSLVKALSIVRETMVGNF